MDRAVDTPIRFLAEPLLGELVQVGPALEGAVAHEEVMLHVADHPLIFAFGLRPGRSAGPRHKAIVTRQIHKPRMKPSRPSHRMLEDRRLLIVYQHLSRHATEPVEASDEAFIGMLRIRAIRAAVAGRVAVADRAALAADAAAAKRAGASPSAPTIHGICERAS